MYDTVQQLVAARAADDNTAMVYRGQRWTWRAHIAEATQQAAALFELADPARPMHVGTLLGNTPAMVTAMTSAAVGGYILCAVNNTRRGEGLARDIGKADIQILLVDAAYRHLLDTIDIGDVRVIDIESEDWRRSLRAAGELRGHRTSVATDPFMMVFTSGTSGDPKAVLVTQLMVAVAAQMLVERFTLTTADVCYVSMPLFHSNAVLAGWGVGVAAGAAIVPATFSASRFLTDIRECGATYMNYVGRPLSFILATAERPDDADNPLRVAFGNEASDRDIAEFARRFDVEVVDGFGSTENAVIIVREPGTPAGSIGRAVSDVAVYHSDSITECATAIFDEHGALANADEAIGELVNTTGSGFFVGYYNDDAATADRMRHGMYWSGDLGYRDADGWIYLAGRTADWMRVNGENLAAAPIERILARHPAVSSVAVYAVPDADGYDQVMATLVPRESTRLEPAGFAEFLAAQPDLPKHGWPRYIRIAAELPTTATNKILKRTLAEQNLRVGTDELWHREERGTRYSVAATEPTEHR